jgi:UDPglucose 6-dehydrogenase
MNITMIGTGYVGLVTGICFADLGHSVTCLDINEEKIAQLKMGRSPIFEEGIDELLSKNIAAGRISFTHSYAQAIPGADLIFICVQTPSGEYGKADLSYVYAAVRECVQHLSGYAVIINKSTSPVGTVRAIREFIAKIAPEKECDVASNPEFLAEGVAIKDFLEPDRIIVGVDTPRADRALREAYAPLIDKGVSYVVTVPQSAELMKYASNSFLAMKLSFINEIADFCELVGADIDEVAHGMGLDKRIGARYLKASIGFGGSCFGKDVRALVHRGEEAGYEFKMVKALIAVNDARYLVVINKLKKHLGNLKGKTIAVLGLAYKAGTDDVRDAQSLRIVFELLDHGARVRATDPQAIGHFKKMFRRADEVTFVDIAQGAAQGADAVLILTEWDEYKNLDLAELKKTMTGGVIVDGRNIINRSAAEAAGFTYQGIGR